MSVTPEENSFLNFMHRIHVKILGVTLDRHDIYLFAFLFSIVLGNLYEQALINKAISYAKEKHEQALVYFSKDNNRLLLELKEDLKIRESNVLSKIVENKCKCNH